MVPFYGATDIALETVGGVRLGDPASLDSLQPGVLFIQQNAPSATTPSAITLRIGSEANRRDVTRFDGGYMALRVQRAGTGSLVGTWASGVTRDEASGYFCATRVDR